MYSRRVTLDTTILLLGTTGGLLHPRVIIATTLLCLLSTEAETTMITDAVLPFLSVIAILPRYRLRTTEAGAVILPHRTLLTVAMADLLRLLLPSMTATIEDLMSVIRLILLLVVEPELLPGFATTTTECRRLGTMTTAVVRPRLLPRGTPMISLAAALRTWRPRGIGAVPKVPLLGLQAVRMSKTTMAVAAETFLATAILVLQGLGIMLPLLRAMDEMALLMLVPTDGLECGLKPILEKQKVLLYQGRLRVRKSYCFLSIQC